MHMCGKRLVCEALSTPSNSISLLVTIFVAFFNRIIVAANSRAMADKPARALVIYGDGAMPAVTPQHEHLHRLAATGSCGFLALRTLPPTVDREAFELSQLLDLVDDSNSPSMAERFMGLKSTFLTTSEPSSVGAKFSTAAQLPDTSDPAAVASNLLGLLGFTESSAKETPNELVFVHVTGSDPTLVNDLVGSVLDSSKEGSLAYGRLFLVVVLGYGDARGRLENVPSFKQESELPELRPRQSYTMKAGKPVEGIREDYPLLAVYHQVAVTRRDQVQQFEFEEFRKRAGNLVMLADRFLYEVAFKLWKAPKYGA